MLYPHEWYYENYIVEWQEGYCTEEPKKDVNPYYQQGQTIRVDEKTSDKSYAFEIGRSKRIVDDMIEKHGQKHVAYGTGPRYSRFQQMQRRYPSTFKDFVVQKKPYRNDFYDDDMPFYKTFDKYLNYLIDWLLINEVTLFITGGALLFDHHLEKRIQYIMSQNQYTAELKDRDADINTRDIEHIVAVPCEKHEDAWKNNSTRDAYREVLHYATYVYHCDYRTYDVAGPSCMQVRNKWMNDHSHYCVTSFMSELWHINVKSGTKNALQLALESDKVIVGFDPITLKYFSTLDGSFPPEKETMEQRSQRDMNNVKEKKDELNLRDDQVYVFGSNESGFHGAGSAAQAMWGRRGNLWRTEFIPGTHLLLSDAPYGEKGLYAVKGIARGLMKGRKGYGYGIQTVTKPGARQSISLDEIEKQLVELWKYADTHPEFEFIMTPVGCGYAGYTTTQIKTRITKITKKYPQVLNIVLPQSLFDHIDINDT